MATAAVISFVRLAGSRRSSAFTACSVWPLVRSARIQLDAATATLPTGTRVYPAPGELFDRFPIESVPARLTRAGERLRVDFIAEADLQ